MRLEFGSHSPSEVDKRPRRLQYSLSAAATKDLVRQLYDAMRKAQIRLEIAEDARKSNQL